MLLFFLLVLLFFKVTLVNISLFVTSNFVWPCWSTSISGCRGLMSVAQRKHWYWGEIGWSSIWLKLILQVIRERFRLKWLTRGGHLRSIGGPWHVVVPGISLLWCPWFPGFWYRRRCAVLNPKCHEWVVLRGFPAQKRVIWLNPRKIERVWC